MRSPLKLMCVLAHPDDESLGMGGTLAKYAREGVETYLVTATRGEKGRFGDGGERPAPEIVGQMRERELLAAAEELGIRQVRFLDYVDGDLDRAEPAEAQAKIAAHFRAVRPHVVATFGPDGAYGHPDHIAISQFTTAALLAAADPAYPVPGNQPPHRVAKLYYMAWSESKWTAYQQAFKKLASNVDGVERRTAPWPDWAITTVVETGDAWPTVWKAVQRHETQVAIYSNLAHLSEESHRALWGIQEFYRAMSLVNGGRRRETDLFEGLREAAA
ncbi:MAG: PIG-L family deacetylase [Bryobacteraceae bacterium]|nr:PIG-L family deacetylase [Bryobacteraceae bacterium]